MPSTEMGGAFTSGTASPTLTPAWAEVVPTVPVESVPPSPMLPDAQEVLASQPPVPGSEPPTVPGLVPPQAAGHGPESEPGESASVAPALAAGGRDPNYFKFPGEIMQSAMIAKYGICLIWISQQIMHGKVPLLTKLHT